jgi:hypothetical protein
MYIFYIKRTISCSIAALSLIITTASASVDLSPNSAILAVNLPSQSITETETPLNMFGMIEEKSEFTTTTASTEIEIPMYATYEIFFNGNILANTNNHDYLIYNAFTVSLNVKVNGTTLITKNLAVFNSQEPTLYTSEVQYIKKLFKGDVVTFTLQITTIEDDTFTATLQPNSMFHIRSLHY